MTTVKRMEYKEPTEDMKSFVERAQGFWKHVDVEAMQPVIHGGDEPSEEVMEQRRRALEVAERNLALFSKQIEAKNKQDGKLLDPIPE
jgi:hypothetical protein